MTDAVDDFLEHFGVKGMRWGVRKNKEDDEVVFTKTLKSGGSVVVTKDRPRGLAKIFKNLQDENASNFTIKDKNGSKVGEASFYKDSDEQLHLEWLGIRKRARGQGYATAAFEGAVKYAKDNNIRRLVLEVPGNSLDAQHIYTKFGFKPTGKDDAATSLFGYEMELIVDPEVRHQSKTLMDYVLDALDNVENELEQSSSVHIFLQHFNLECVCFDHRVLRVIKKGGN